MSVCGCVLLYQADATRVFSDKNLKLTAFSP